ncbi:coiled-coil domain-containing protein 171-like [Amphiura filiformis]|uniref:coiled-coil domain-containing protein 171-like n=1 Tax=Amphiura filiformis TaxID=82378 RepID=UPI003B227046
METAGSTLDWPGSEFSASELFRDRGLMRTSSSLTDEVPRLTVDEVQQLRAQFKQLQSDSNHEAGTENDNASLLRQRINKLEKDKLELTTNLNDETSKLQSQVAKLRAQVEEGEVTRQNLEYELAVAKKSTGQGKRNLKEKTSELNGIIETYKDKIVDLKQQVDDLQHALESQKRVSEELDGRYQHKLEEKDGLLATCQAERDLLTTEKEQLQHVFQEQENIYAEAQEKLAELETERDIQTDTVRQQLNDLEYAAEKETRLKKELEAAIIKIKSIEEGIEAERAAHLESKFNSEVVQLRVCDLDGALEVEKAANTQADLKMQTMQRQIKELEGALREEKESHRRTEAELEHLNIEHASVKGQLTAELENKHAMIGNLSKQLQLHQGNFDELKQELSKAKKRQIYLEETYGGSMRELELLLQNFQITCAEGVPKRGKGKKSQQQHGDRPLTPSVVLETLRHTLTDYQRRLDHTSQELNQMKARFEKMTNECESYKEVTWTRSQTVQDLQKKFVSTNRDLEKTRRQLNESEAQVATMRMELQQVIHEGEKEKSRAEDMTEEFKKQHKNMIDSDETKRIYLHSVYQRMLAGRVVISNRESALSTFTWDELSMAVQDQVVSLINTLNRAQDKIEHLETVVRNKDELLKEIQDGHEESLLKLASSGRMREEEWQNQRLELEEHFSRQLADLQSKSKKSQAMADQAWERARLTGTVKESLESECMELEQRLIQTQREHSALLATCGLLSGALYPHLYKMNLLASQRAFLEEQLCAMDSFKSKAKELAETLAMEIEDVGRGTSERRGRNLMLLFRVGVIAVIAANRLKYLGSSSQRLFTSVDNPCCVYSMGVSIGSSQQRKLMGLQAEFNSQRDSIEGQAKTWFSSQELLSAVMSSVPELQETLHKPDSHTDPHTVTACARKAFISLMGKLSASFQTSLQTYPTGYGGREKGSLVRFLAHGLNRCMAHSSMAGKSNLNSSQQIMSSLQQNIISFTQRLHSAEVERRSLRMETAKLKDENKTLKRKSQDTDNMDKELNRLRQQTSGLIQRNKFESVCQELSNALQREHQAQQLLNEQSTQLEELSMRLNMHTAEEMERNSTISEAVKELSDAKMQLKRKEQLLHQLNRQISNMEGEKKSLQDNVLEAERALGAVSKDKESFAVILQSVQSAVEDTKRQLIARVDSHTIETTLTQILSLCNRRGLDGTSPDIMATKGLVSLFVELQQTSLSRISALEAEINSHKQHITRLKKELQAACRREYEDSEGGNSSRNGFDKLDFLPVSSLGSRSRPLYESERSYKEDFAPLRAEVDYSIQATHSTPVLTRHSTNRRHDSFTSPKKTKVSSHLSESHRSSRTSPYGSNEES